MARHTTLHDYYNAYATRQIWTPQTARAVELAVRTAPFLHTPLRQVRPTDIETWIRSMHDANLAPSTIRTRVANVRSVLASAQRDGVITANPVNGVRLPRVTRRPLSVILPTEAQVRQLIATSPPPFDVLFALCAYAGLRLGEALALEWSAVDLDRRTLTVRQQVRLIPGGGREIAAPKYNSHRNIPIEPELFEIFVKRSPRMLEELVAGRGSHPTHPVSAHRAWVAAKSSAGIAPELRIHDLRHWYASRLIDAGATILAVQRRLGHSQASTTLDVYAHVLTRAS